MQKYMFGKMQLYGGDVQCLSVSADHEINLSVGMRGSRKEGDSDSAVPTVYRVARKIKNEMMNGLHYKWYLVDNVNRRTGKNENSIMERLNALENVGLALPGGETDA